MTTRREPHPGPPTLDSVAALADVSRATAGRVLSASPKVSDAARAAVLDAAARLGYVANQAARSLATRRSESIAFVVAEPEDRVFGDPFFPAVLRGAHRVVAEHRYQLVFVLLSTDADREQLQRFAAGGHVDGAVFLSLHGDDPLPGRLRAGGLPVVVAGRPFRAGDDVPHVDADNAGGGRLATRALLDSGCHRLAIVTGPLDMPPAQDRLAGFEAELAARGLAPAAVVTGDFTDDSGYRAMRELLALDDVPDGVFAANDSMAVGVLRAARERGLAVPGDLRVVGFDDSPLAAAANPPLTTVRQPLEALGRAVATLLLALVDGAPAPPTRMLATELVRRGSCP